MHSQFDLFFQAVKGLVLYFLIRLGRILLGISNNHLFFYWHLFTHEQTCWGHRLFSNKITIKGGPEKRDFHAWGTVNSLYFYRRCNGGLPQNIFMAITWNSIYKQVQFCLQKSLPIWSLHKHLEKNLNSQEYHGKYLWKHLYEKKIFVLEADQLVAPGCKACWSLEYSKSTATLSNGAASLALFLTVRNLM